MVYDPLAYLQVTGRLSVMLRFPSIRGLRELACWLLVALLLAVLGGCGTLKVRTVYDQPEGPTIVIGVPADEFGLGLWHEGAYSGFEISVAKYVAGKLGYANKQIVFKRVAPATRMQVLSDGAVDMLVAGVPMPSTASAQGVASDDRAQYAGPYLTTSQGLLVRSDATADIDGISSLAGRNVCTVAGSGASERLLAERSDVKVHERDTYPQCVTDLMIGRSDAVAADAVILAGLSREQGRGVTMRVRGVSYGTVRYGIAVRSDAATLAKDISEALEAMRADGSYDAFVKQLESDTGGNGW